jgi:hypothetical protein
MNKDSFGTANVLPEATLRLLRELRSRLLHLHKILLEMERADYERVSGRLTSGELLQLVINHVQFAWLRQLSALVVQLDELLDAEDPALPDDLQNVLGQARSLFTSPADEAFREKYQAALQRNPEAVLAHSEVARLLRES